MVSMSNAPKDSGASLNLNVTPDSTYENEIAALEKAQEQEKMIGLAETDCKSSGIFALDVLTILLLSPLLIFVLAAYILYTLFLLIRLICNRILSSHKKLNESILRDIQTYLEKHWIYDPAPNCGGFGSNKKSILNELNEVLEQKLYSVLNEQAPSFSETLLQIINEKGVKKYSDVYKKVDISRQCFQKILSGRRPSKDMAIRLAFGLGLNLGEAVHFLNTAGYALSNSSKRDMIIQFCIENNCSTYLTDELLCEHDEKELFYI